jgi:hypothetical protein
MHIFAGLKPFRAQVGVAATLAAFAAAPLVAQTAASGNTAPVTSAPTSQFGVDLSTNYDEILSSDLSSGASGNLSEARWSTSLKGNADWDGNHLGIGASYTYDNYDIGTASGKPPFSNVQGVGLDLNYMREIGDNWGAFTLMEGGFAAETATTLTRGEQFGAAVGPTYNITKYLLVYFGPAYYTRLEDSNTWWGQGGVTWQIARQWRLKGDFGVINDGKLTYDIFSDGQTVADLSGEYDSNWFRTVPTPAGSQAVNERYLDVSLGVTQQFWTYFYVRPYAEVVTMRNYQFRVNGGAANSFDVDTSVGLGLQAGAKY